MTSPSLVCVLVVVLVVVVVVRMTGKASFILRVAKDRQVQRNGITYLLFRT